MVDALLIGGVVIAAFVAYNIGGSTTGPAFGPAVGAEVVSKTTAAGLMSVFFFLGAWTLGRRVVDTLGTDLVSDPGVFTPEASIVVLFFVGGALLLGNVTGVPASTSMTAVGAIAGLAIATGDLEWAVVGEIVSWWIVSPVLGFWLSVMIGRYLYTRIDRWLAIDGGTGPAVVVDRSGWIPIPRGGPKVSRRQLAGRMGVVAIGSLMAFSSGTSNIANAIAPLVGSDAMEMNAAILLGTAAVAVGTFTIARRTMETLGNDITDLPLTAAFVVAVVSSTIVVALSAAGIPASFVIIATMNIVGLGWGRATRTITVADAVRGRSSPEVSVGALTAESETATVGDPERGEGSGAPPIGEEDPGDIPAASTLFDPSTTARVVAMQNVVPILATVGSYVTTVGLLRIGVLGP